MGSKKLKTWLYNVGGKFSGSRLESKLVKLCEKNRVIVACFSKYGCSEKFPDENFLF